MPVFISRRLTASAVVIVAVGSLLASASPASAIRPEKESFENDFSFSIVDPLDLCNFSIDVTGHVSGFDLVFFDQEGDLTKVISHVTEQDTFSANGNTLEGLPYHFTIRVLFDDNGEVTHVYGTGVTERVPLPGGGTFFGAGRVDLVARNRLRR
ncbi:MAG: hypothetical protein WKF82_10875 [Nocardioidaceae bacterium]